MSILNVSVYSVKGHPGVFAGDQLGQRARVAKVVGLEAGKGWVRGQLPMRRVRPDLRQYTWGGRGHGLRLDQIRTATVAQGKDLEQAAVWVTGPDDLGKLPDGLVSSALWLSGHVPMYLSPESLEGRMHPVAWQRETRGNVETDWTSALGQWQHHKIGKLHLAVWQERVFDDHELANRRIGFGQVRWPQLRDCERFASLVNASSRDIFEQYLQEDADGVYLDISRWPILGLPTRRLDWLLGQTWLHGPTLQVIRQTLDRADVRAEWDRLAPWQDAGFGAPCWDTPDREVFHPGAYYVGDTLVQAGTCQQPERPVALGTPVWLPVAGGQQIDSDPRPASLEGFAGWLFDHMDRDGNVAADDQDRWERAGADYALAEEERQGPTWQPRRYQDRDGNPLPENALKDGLVLLGQFEKLADDAESGWLLDRRGRKARHARVQEGLAEWRGRVTTELRTALRSAGKAGRWVLEELVAQRDRCLKALGRKKGPGATLQDRIDELVTDLLYASQVGGEFWQWQEALRIGLLAEDSKGRRVLKQALRQAKAEGLFETDGLLEKGKLARAAYYEEHLLSFIDAVLAA